MEELPDREPNAETPGVFYRELTAELLRLSTRARLTPARAQDVAQAIWLKFCKKFPSCARDAGRDYHRAWLLTAAQHVIVDAIRVERRHPTRALDEESMVQRAQSSTNRASDDAHSALFRRWLEGLRQSDPLAHQLVWGRHIEGTSIADLAKQTGWDARGISKRIHAALNKFRAWLLKHQDDSMAAS